MDREEKIARLGAWLQDHPNWSQMHGTISKQEGGRKAREYDAVLHELNGQVDKRIVEDLGVFKSTYTDKSMHGRAESSPIKKDEPSIKKDGIILSAKCSVCGSTFYDSSVYTDDIGKKYCYCSECHHSHPCEERYD